MPKKYIVFDIGGTLLKYGIISDNADILEYYCTKTPYSLELLVEVISEYAKLHSEASGIGISSPGSVSEKGVIYGSSALDYLHGPNVKKIIKYKTGMPVYMENDANCAAYAEMWLGAARDYKDFIMIVIGTGVGGAIVKNRELHKGANLHGGEIGQMLLNDNFSGKGWTRMESTVSLVGNVANRKRIDKDTLTGEKVFELAELGDEVCIQAIDRFYHLLAIGIFNLQYIYDPEIILVGGGISARQDLVIEINKRIEKMVNEIPQARIKPTINTSHFRQNANLLGAAYGIIKEANYE